MTDRIVQVRLFILMVFSVAAVLVSFLSWQNYTSANYDDNFLSVAFLDVGQGDAIFIETRDGVQVLIDGGAGSSVLRELTKQMPIGDRSIDLVIATHFDKDHIAGLVDVLKRYQVDVVLMTNNINNTVVTKAFKQAVEDSGALVYVAQAGQQLLLGEETLLVVWSPDGDATHWESNTASIVTQLKYKEIDFMLTGDAPLNIENHLVKTWGEVLQSEVLKLGHHGSRTSTSDLFLDTVKPNFGVVSAGSNNTYGHPHDDVVSRVTDRGIDILSTAEVGTILFKSDGELVWVE